MTMLDIYIRYNLETRHWELTLPEALKNKDGSYRVTPDIMRMLAESIAQMSEKLEANGHELHSA